MKLKPLKYKKYVFNTQKKHIVETDGSDNKVRYETKHFLNDLYENKINDEFGLMAQEIYTIPELRFLVEVPYYSDISAIANTTIYDGSLNEPDGYYEAQGWGVKEPARLNYQGFIPLLIKGFQEQQAVITQQQAVITQQQAVINNITTENNDLKNENTELRNKIANIEEILSRNNIN